MKRPLKILLVAVGAGAALAAVLVALAFTPAVQTWAVRRAVAGVPGVKIEVGRAALGLRSVRLDHVRVEQPGLVLILPAAVVELPLADAIKGRVAIARLVAKGWTLDLTGAAPAKPATPTGAFEGVFKFLKLPVTLALEQAELDGDVVQAGGKTHVTVNGGGLGAGREGMFKITTAHTATAADTPAQTASASAELTVGMDRAGTISGLALTAEVTAAGPKINGEARARLNVSARRDAAGGESYAVGVRAGERELASLEAVLPAGGGALTGKWAVDADDANLAPLRQFLPAGPLPVFAAKGQGAFSASRDLKQVSAAGKIAGSTDKLEALRPELAAMGRVEFAADFDAEERDGLTRVTRLTVTLGGAEPLATVEALQAFAFDRAKNQLTPTNLAADLVRASLRNVPLAWAQPWLPAGLRLTGSLSAALTVGARDGGFAARVMDFAVRESRMTKDGQTVWQGEIAAPGATLSYSPQGWQAEIPAIAARAGSISQSLAGLRASQAANAGQPLILELKEGLLDLAGVRLMAPTVAGQLPATGSVRFSLTASLAEKKQLALKLALTGGTAGPQRQALPDATLDLRADLAADGGIALNAPITLTHGARKSDLTLGGTFTPTKAGWNFDAQAAGDTLHIDDLTVLATLAPERSSAPKGAGPPWSGLAGTVKFALKRVVFSPTYAGSVAGTLLLDGSGPRLDAYGALDGPSPSPFTAKAGVTHTPGAAVPYTLTADIELRGFQLGALRSTLEASVDLGLRLTSRAATPDGLAAAAQGKFQLSSKGGVTHLLAKSAPLQIVGTGAALLGAFTGNSTAGAVSRGVARISDLLQEIRFDQLNVLLSRDASNDLVLEDFTLVAPEVRLIGKGRVTSVPGRELAELPLALTFQLAARGSLGDGLRSLGLISAQPDALGYYPMAFEPQIGGTVGSPDKAPFYNQLMQRALTALVGGTLAPAAPASGGAGQSAEGLLKEAAGGLLNGLFK